MQTDITIISARWIIPVEPRGRVLEQHCLVISNGRIIDICTLLKAQKKYPQGKLIERPNHVLLPGLINAHTHSAMSLFRGMADDISLMDWLNLHIWPAEQQWISPDFIRDGAELAIAEMLLSGTTCFNDMYFYPDIVANTAQEIGIRATVGMIIIDFPSAWAKSSVEYFQKAIAVHDDCKTLSRIETAFAPHAPYSANDESLQTVRTYADELSVPVHMHVHETEQEIADSLEQYQKRPLQRLDQLGLLNPRLLAVHMTKLNDNEIKLCAERGIHIVHCPRSNQKLASGSSPINALLKAKVNVCLGTDSAASNNDLNMLGEMRAAALNAKNHSKNAQSLPAAQVLEMATINAARALNLDEHIGSLKIGKAADIIAIDLQHIATQPVYEPLSQVIYSASRQQVSDVWVAGQQLLKNRQLTSINHDKLLSKTQTWGEKIAQHHEQAN